MSNASNNAETLNPSRLPMPAEASHIHGLDVRTWSVLADVIFPAAKTPGAIVMALDYCKARNLDIFKRPVHIVPMWSARLGREVETVWPSIQEIQTTASRTGLWAGMDTPVWGPDITRTFSGQAKNPSTGKLENVAYDITFPEWCAVTVYRMVGNVRCAFTEPVYWLEAYSSKGKSEIPTPMWIKRPRGQHHKCAKAASLRAAFPEECGEYAAEEMQEKVIDDFAAPPAIDGTSRRVEDEAPAQADAKPKDAAKGSRKEPPAGASAYPQPPAGFDLSKIGEQVRKTAAQVVDRAKANGTWEAAREWAGGKFAADDLAFVLAELDKAASQDRVAPAAA
jgi:phage recombination protein Bet